MLGKPHPGESLRLAVAFYCIMEPEKRTELIALAEKFAMASPDVEGIDHFRAIQRTSAH